MIQISLEQQSVLPGDRVAGRVTWKVPKDATPRRIQVFLGWHTEGRGSTASDKVVTYDHDCGPVIAGDEVTFPFDFDLPHDVPISFDGQLIRMIWTIHVNVDLPWAFDPKESAILHVAGPVVPA